jgi:DNA repair protein RadD
VAAEVDELMNTTDNVNSAVREIVAITRERNSVLIFAASVDHAQRIKETIERFTKQECGLVTGETLSTEREKILRRFKGETFQKDLLGSESKPLKFLVNVNVLTTGFDAPNIDCVVLLRPTASAGLYVQMVGRGFRLHETKTDCLVLDYGGNIMRHGPVDAIHVKDKNDKGSGTAPQKECPECQSIVNAAAKTCSDCGYEFPVTDRDTLANTASNEGVLSGEIVDTEYEVDDVVYSVHSKRGASEDDPKTLRIDYRVGLNDYHSEWACPEHSGWARKKFEKWWQERSNDPLPDTAELAARIGDAGGIADTKTITVCKVGGERFGRIVKYTLGEKPHSVSENFEPDSDSDYDQY